MREKQLEFSDEAKRTIVEKWNNNALSLLIKQTFVKIQKRVCNPSSFFKKSVLVHAQDVRYHLYVRGDTHPQKPFIISKRRRYE